MQLMHLRLRASHDYSIQPLFIYLIKLFSAEFSWIKSVINHIVDPFWTECSDKISHKIVNIIMQVWTISMQKLWFSSSAPTMKITLFTLCVLLFIGTFCHGSNGDLATAKPVQIITPVNHTFQLELNNLKPILEADDIKDRHVVVVSIAGAFRKGKSFLSNFFIRYLYAQVRKSIFSKSFFFDPSKDIRRK